MSLRKAAFKGWSGDKKAELLETKDEGSKKSEKPKTKREREQEAWANEGGYMNAKIQKLINKYDADKERQRGEDGSIVGHESQIFSGVAIFINGYTEPSFDVLRQLMIDHGGTFEHYYSATRVTHIIATSLAYSKQQQFASKKVVLPSWITDSVEQKKLLPFGNYLLLGTNTLNKYFNPVDDFSKPSDQNTATSLASRRELFPDENIDDVYIMANMVEVPSIQPAEPPPARPQSGASDRSDDMTMSTSGLTVRNNPTTSSHMLSADDSGFIAEFYGNSRLHHISHWRTLLKEMVNDIRSDPEHKLTGRDKLIEKMQKLHEKKTSQEMTSQEAVEGKLYMHIDMDCFFVSVAVRHRPELKDKPVVVAHSKGDPHANKNKPSGSMSEIACCSYLAREAGVRNGMMMGRALTLCPNLKSVPYDFDGYSEVSTKLYNIVASYTKEIEAVSCDELYVDISSLLSIASVNEIASELRQHITKETGCPCSAGIGPNLLVARLATRKAKPDGQCFVQLDDVENFMLEQKVADLPGVGRATSRRLEQLNVRTCRHLQALSITQLKHEFGVRSGEVLYKLCRGQDERKLKPDQIRQSVSCDINYGIRFTENEQVESLFKNIATEVSKKLVNAKLIGKQVTLKLMIRAADAPEESAKFMGHGICDSFSKSSSLKAATASTELIYIVCINIWRSLDYKPSQLRGVGIQLTKLEPIKSLKSTSQAKLTDFKSTVSTSSVSIVRRKGTESQAKVSWKGGRKDSARVKGSLSFESKAKPALCGNREAEEICRLLDRWFSFSQDGPNRKDKEQFDNFMTSLVKTYDLECVKALLIHMKWTWKEKTEWMKYLEQLLFKIKNTVASTYDADFEFSIHTYGNGSVTSKVT